MIAANAGSGKTTLVADFVRNHSPQYVWYQLDHSDADPLAFLGYITHGIRQVIPDFGSATLAYLQQATAELGAQPERAVDVLLNEVVDQVEQQLILVLDDYHHLGANTPVHGIVDRLLAYLPDVMHAIIISREMPPLSLTRLRSQSALAVIDRADLLFTDSEIKALFAQVFGIELTPAQLAEYGIRTEGWITALQLIRQVAHRQALAAEADPGGEAAALSDLTEVLRHSERDIFDYFGEEVFADEPEPIRQLLLSLSLLECIELDTCNQMFPEARCSEILPALVRRNVFITVASDGLGEEFRLHPLFQSFLRRRLLTVAGRAGVAAQHASFADYFLGTHRRKEAMHHLLAAEDVDRAATVLAEHGQDWIASGALTSVASFTEALPADVLEKHPRALAHRAEVARLRGDYEVARALFRRAVSLLHGSGDSEGEAEALHSLAAIARGQGDFMAAFEYLDRAVELAPEFSPVRVKCGNTRGLCLAALGRWADAEREFHTALQSAEERRDEHYARLILHNLGLPAMIRGDFGEALHWLRRLLRDDNNAPLPQEASAHLNMARCHLYRGELAAGEQHLERALERCQLFNLVAVRAEVLETYGNLYRERGDAARAAEHYERAKRTYEQAGIDLARRELLEEQAQLGLETGDLMNARALLERLVSARTVLKDEMGVQAASLALSRVILAQGDHEGAQTRLEPALDYFHRNGLYYYEAQACVALATCDLAAGREVPLLERLHRALDLALRYDYEYWLQREVARQPRLFTMADEAELLPPDLREHLSAALRQSEPAVVQAQPATFAPAADLTINLLGPVDIFRDSQRPLAADAWTTRRARDILCFIVSRRHRRASKDMIIDTFWGDADFENVARNFHPTVSHIRKALKSNQPLKLNFLVYRDGDYLLNPEFVYRIDIEEFERMAAEADSARRAGNRDQCIGCYEAAIRVYRGEFMQGCYDKWAEEQRSYYREQALHMLEALVMAAQEAREWQRSLQLAEQILRDDPFREDVYCFVMRAHAAQGNRVAAKEQYESLRSLLQRELGVDPLAETQKVYRELIESETGNIN